MLHVSLRDIDAFDFQGLKICDYTPGGAESASVAVVEIPPGASHRTARSARSDKFYFCVRGQVAFEVAGQPVTLNPSDLLVISRMEWFSYRNGGDSDAHLLLMHVPPFDLDAEEFLEEGDS